jgi:hypothetical protein
MIIHKHILFGPKFLRLNSFSRHGTSPLGPLSNKARLNPEITVLKRIKIILRVLSHSCIMSLCPSMGFKILQTKLI